MTVWRPRPAIQVKVLGLARRGDRFLAAEVTDDAGQVKGVRPLGGTVEFGETFEAALAREFMEELGTGIRLTGPWRSFQNLYVHEGEQGHEIVFIAEIELIDRSWYARDRFTFNEGDGTGNRAGWFDPDALRRAGIALYPTGLDTLLRSPPRPLDRPA